MQVMLNLQLVLSAKTPQGLAKFVRNLRFIKPVVGVSLLIRNSAGHQSRSTEILNLARKIPKSRINFLQLPSQPHPKLTKFKS